MHANGNSGTVEVLRVVVTGGSAGIGRSIVETFASRGHRVLFTYLTGKEASCALEARFNTVTKTHLDQGCVDSVQEFGRTVKQWAGDDGVDVLVNNAALGSATVSSYVDSNTDAGAAAGTTTNASPSASSSGSTEALSCSMSKVARQAQEDISLMRVNALGPLWVTEAVMGSLRTTASASRRRWTSAIFIGSVGGGSSAVFPEYRASDLMSKAAMTYLVKHLAAQYVQDSLDVMCVAPGATETAMFRASTLSKVSDVGAFVESMPKRALIQPQQVADAVYWLATDPSARIFHGAVLDASLGLAVRPGLQTESVKDR